jgi:hypothetical protein
MKGVFGICRSTDFWRRRISLNAVAKLDNGQHLITQRAF